MISVHMALPWVIMGSWSSPCTFSVKSYSFWDFRWKVFQLLRFLVKSFTAVEIFSKKFFSFWIFEIFSDKLYSVWVSDIFGEKFLSFILSVLELKARVGSLTLPSQQSSSTQRQPARRTCLAENDRFGVFCFDRIQCKIYLIKKWCNKRMVSTSTVLVSEWVSQSLELKTLIGFGFG